MIRFFQVLLHYMIKSLQFIWFYAGIAIIICLIPILFILDLIDRRLDKLLLKHSKISIIYFDIIIDRCLFTLMADVQIMIID